MNTHAQRAFAALAAVAVVAAAVFGVVGLTMTKASAATCSWTSAPTTGNVGDILQFKVRIYDPDSPGAQWISAPEFRIILPNGQTQPLPTQLSDGPSIEGRGILYVDATTSYTFTSAGRYTIIGARSLCGSITVTIAAAATPSAIASVTPTPTVSGGGSNGGSNGGGGGGDVIGQAEEGIADIASQAGTATGLGSNALYTMLAVIVIVLLAIIATALLMRRRDEDEYEYEKEDRPYQRERRYKR